MPLKTTFWPNSWYNWHISKQIRAMTYFCFRLFLVWWIILCIHKYHSIEHRLNQFIRFVLLASSLPNCRPPSPGLGGFCASCRIIRISCKWKWIVNKLGLRGRILKIRLKTINDVSKNYHAIMLFHVFINIISCAYYKNILILYK